MTNTEKVAYIRGLAEGLELDDSKKEVKVLNAIIDLLDDLAMSLADLEDGYSDMADQLDAVDEDLGSLEDDFYGDDEDDEDEITVWTKDTTITPADLTLYTGAPDIPASSAMRIPARP